MPSIVDERLPEIEALCRRHRVRRLDLFGSAATGRFRPGESDLDFLVDFEPGPAPDARPDLQEALQALFGSSVDLVSDAAVRDPIFRRAVDHTRVPIYASASAPPVPAPSTTPISEAELMEIRTRQYLEHMHEGAAFITEAAAGKTLDDYTGSLMLRSAVERQFEVIGEAIAKLGRVDPSTAARISNHQRIVAFRSIIVHFYYALDNAKVWSIVQNDLPTLLQETRALLSER